MLIVVSPYHLTTREAPAMAALLLGSRVVTLVPANGERTAREAHRVAGRVKAYAELARSWSWATDLFDAGVIAGEAEGERPDVDVRRVMERVGVDDRYAALRAFVRGAEGEEETHLAAISSDILRGGPDPGLSVPVAGGLDRYATRLGAFVARSPAASIAQNAEARLGRTIVTVSLPILVQADASRVVHAREVLMRPLRELRRALACVPAAVRERGEVAGAVAKDVTDAVGAYTSEFENRRADIMGGAADDDVRLIESATTISVVALPSDAVLTSGVTAMRVMGGRRAAEADTDVDSRSESCGGLPVLHDEAEGRFVAGLVVKVLGRR